MARPKASLPSAERIRAVVSDDGRLAVRVTPGARSESLEVADGMLLARVRAKPQDGAANAAVIALVAAAIGLAPSQVELLRGDKSRDKLLRLRWP